MTANTAEFGYSHLTAGDRRQQVFRTGESVAQFPPLQGPFRPADEQKVDGVPPGGSDTGGIDDRLAGKGLSVSLRQVSKSFGQRQILKDIDLEIPAGQFVAIVGRSGGGKSTLLRLLTGLDQPSSGDITIAGQGIDGLQSSVRLLFQEARLLPWQRVLSNVGIARGPHWRETAMTALRDVGLADRAHDWPAVLSGGQRQRVALARALVNHPGILLLDEPFGALDALTRIEMHQLITQIWQEHRFTAILITHDVHEAITLADRVLVLRDGRFVFDETIIQPRPRALDDAKLAHIEKRVLAAV
ncbi:MAG TPA: ATP-binding cassette domain-containing protein [Dongiaceae bacterium]|nr:ATP-binding cassette domain-containing protein [Dongiaceae bacterium]